MKQMKKALFLSMIIFLIIVSAACSGNGGTNNNDGTSDGGDSQGERTVIEYWHTYGEQEERVLYEQVKPAFEEAHPEYELNLTRQPFEGLKQQVIAGVAGNATPDIMRMDLVWVSEFAEMGALTDLSTFEGFEETKEQIFEGPMSTNFFEGGYYGLPLNTNTKVAIYNKELLEAAGYSEPPKTMEELEDAARNAVDNGAAGGIAIVGLGQTWDYLPYFWSLGGSLTNDDFSQFEGYLNSEESYEAFSTILRWHEEGLTAPTILDGQPGTWEGIERDQYMMIDDGPWFFSILMNDEARPDPMDYTVIGQIPEGAGGSRAPIGGENIVMFENSDNKEAAWVFLQWMAGEEAQTIMARGTGLIPVNMEAANDSEFLELPFAQSYVTQLETALPRTPTHMWSEIEEAITLNVERVFRGEMDLREALDDAAQKADELLNQ